MDSSHQDLALVRAENERLRAALRDLRAAQARDEAKTRFLAVVSHELRTPLSAVIGLADLLALSALEDEQRAYVEAMRGCAHSLVGLVDEILDLARIEAGRLEMIRAPFAPRALMEGVAELLAPRAQARGLEIAAFVAPGVPARVMGDGLRVRQILLNLAGNALKFTQTGGVGLSLRAEGERLVFDVSDTGPGVPEDRRAAIFEDFEQADAGTSRVHEGAGLGLAISRRLAARMGGALTLAATGPQGSVFRYDHPLDLDFSGAPAAPDDEAAPADEDASALAGLRVLVVGRSRFEIPFLLASLAGFGAEVVHAPDGLSGEVALAEGPAPDLVIIDCALGAERAGEIRAAARAAGAGRALLLFSPYERRAAGPQGLADFDGWLVKPVRAASLRERARAPLGAPEPRLAPAPAAPLSGLRVLLAEDNEINALVARKHLAHLGADVVHVRDGRAAVEAAGRARRGEEPAFDAILMDMRMPVLDGPGAARVIRAQERALGGPPLRIVALTANAFAEDRRACLDAGVDEFLTKPFLPLDLARALAPERLASSRPLS